MSKFFAGYTEIQTLIQLILIKLLVYARYLCKHLGHNSEQSGKKLLGAYILVGGDTQQISKLYSVKRRRNANGKKLVKGYGTVCNLKGCR